MHTIDLDNTLRAHVRTVCAARLLTQQEIADAVGLHRTALANWLGNRRSMPLKTASRLITLIGPARVGRDLLETATPHRSKSADRIANAIESREQLHTLARQLSADSCAVCAQEAGETEATEEVPA